MPTLGVGLRSCNLWSSLPHEFGATVCLFSSPESSHQIVILWSVWYFRPIMSPTRATNAAETPLLLTSNQSPVISDPEFKANYFEGRMDSQWPSILLTSDYNTLIGQQSACCLMKSCASQKLKTAALKSNGQGSSPDSAINSCVTLIKAVMPVLFCFCCCLVDCFCQLDPW